MKNTKLALITGASSGIGWEMAKILASKGYDLVITARREDRLLNLKKEIESQSEAKVSVVTEDLSVKGSAKSLFDKVSALGTLPDAFINNAGFGIQGEFLTMDPERMEQMHQLNMLTFTQLTQYYAQAMVKRGSGMILQVASAAAFLPTPYVSSYAATKSYAGYFSEAVGYELRDTGVSVTTLYPGFTATEFGEVAHVDPHPFLKLLIMEAGDVANSGINAMLRKKRAIVPGLFNKLNAYFSLVLPRGLLMKMVGPLMK